MDMKDTLKSIAAPAVIATWSFGEPAARIAWQQIQAGGAALDAVEAGITHTELDTSVNTVGYGGHLNAAGQLELDAAIMDGEGHQAGAVAALQQIRTPLAVARRLMERSPHVMLAGDGALLFALNNGFEREDTVTPEARHAYEEWLKAGRPGRWLGGLSLQDSVVKTGSGIASAPGSESHDTIGLCALDSAGRLAVGCSTSGIAFKAPGRVGDSPLVGGGLYVDKTAGAAAATGVGEVILRHCLSFLVVEGMRSGLSPQEACDRSILRVIQTDERYRTLQVGVIALSPDGRTGASSTRPPQSPLTYAVANAAGVRYTAANIPFGE